MWWSQQIYPRTKNPSTFHVYVFVIMYVCMYVCVCMYVYVYACVYWAGGGGADVWLDFIAFHLAAGHVTQAEALYARAVRAVPDPAAFSALYDALK